MNWRKILARLGIYQWTIFIKKIFQKPRSKQDYCHLLEGGYLTKWQTDVLIKIKSGKHKVGG